MARLPLPPLQLPGPGQTPASAKSVSAFESYANLLKQARETASTETAGRQRPEAEEGDLISVSRSPSPAPVSPGPSPLNISCVSDTSSKSSHSLLSEAEARPGHPLLDINKNGHGADLSKLTTPSHPLFPFGLSPPQLPSPLSPLYNPLTFAASPLYRLRYACRAVIINILNICFERLFSVLCWPLTLCLATHCSCLVRSPT